jgi:hypothetical protein
MARRLCLAMVLLCVLPAISAADSLPIGLLSFNTSIFGNPGTNAFTISNFTGIFALPPDFPVLDSLIFLGSTLTVVQASGSTVFNLGDLGPGDFSVEVSQSEVFLSALFTATLSQTMFQLANGSFFIASPTFSTDLLPAAGSTLTPDVDLAVMNVSGTIAQVTEPISLLLVPMGLCALVILNRRSRRNSRPLCTNGF